MKIQGDGMIITGETCHGRVQCISMLYVYFVLGKRSYLIEYPFLLQARILAVFAHV